MPQVILALDLGSYSIKLTRAERSMGEFAISDFFEIPFEQHEALSPEQVISVTLKKFFEEHPLSYDTAITALSGTETALRTLDFPFTQAAKIDSAIDFELETFVPFPVEDLCIDYIPIQKKASQTTVIAAYTPKAQIAKFLGMLSEANFDPRYVGVESLDLANLYHSRMLPPQGCYALLDLGHSKTQLTLLSGGELKLARTISIGGKHITEAIAKVMEVDFSRAQQIKHSEGQISAFDSSSELTEAIQEVVDQILVQVRQTLFAFYEKGGSVIEAVFLCGGTSRLSGIDQYLSTVLKLNVSPLDVLDYSFSHLKDPETARVLIAPCVAMVLRAVYPGKTVSLNFRRDEFAYTRDIQAISAEFKPMAIAAIVVLVLGVVYFSFSLYLLGDREQKLNKSVASLLTQGLTNLPKKVPEKMTDAQNLIKDRISKSQDELSKLQSDSALSALEILRMISMGLPSRQDLKLDVDDLNIATDHVRLEGRTVSYEAVDKVKSSLEKISQFKNVQTGNVRKGVQDEIKFSLSFDIGV
ncbi:MAG: pilus assembly protein PilM [Deltaproteobacteria bacterium]|nr:pilus assembly protein PilM [Deltaproteobacteria bacterium]